jgi:hypothetical protein
MLYDGRATDALDKRPGCSFCTDEAVIDGATKMGPWGYLCGLHFILVGVGIGVGKGQYLLVGDALDEAIVKLLSTPA